MVASAKSSVAGKSKKKAAAKRVRPRRDFEALKRRRMRAAAMFARGRRQAEVARVLEVSSASVSAWYEAWSRGGKEALAGAGRAGRRPRLTDEQLVEVLAQLLKGPAANGYDNGLWTLARVAAVIERTTGVRYSQTQTWEILRRKLDWTRQRPARRALERNDRAIIDWIEKDWPRIKKAPAAAGRGSSSRTRAASPCSPR